MIFENSLHDMKMHSNDRILVLEVLEGKTAKDVTGMIDTRLFKGGNNLHAVMDERTNLWSLRYEAGLVPEPLRQQFTTFNKLLDFCKKYFLTRNLIIKEVKG